MLAGRKVTSIGISLRLNCLLMALARGGRDPVATLSPVLIAFKRKDALSEDIQEFILEGIWNTYVYRWGNNDNVSIKVARAAKKKLAGLSNVGVDLPDDAQTLRFLAEPMREQAQEQRRGRGGDRKSGTRSNQTHLIRILIRLNHEASKRMPFHNSERDVDGKALAQKRRAPIGWGGPVERFVRAGLEAIERNSSLPISPTAIKRVFQRMKKEGALKSRIL
jgi:hypothetical protein